MIRVSVKPGTFEVRRMQHTQWKQEIPIDEFYSNEELEWVCEKQWGIVITGMMFRETRFKDAISQAHEISIRNLLPPTKYSLAKMCSA